jgi:hypothetical protein
MRLALDAHLSSQRIGDPLRDDGHDVLAAQLPSALAQFEDIDLLRFCGAEGRVLVTCNRKDFAPITIDFADRGESHAGCLMLAGIRHDEVGVALRAVRQALLAYPAQSEWKDLVVAAGRP